MPSDRPTIFALSSGRGPAAIAVVRMSGPRARAALEALGVKIPEPRKAGLARLRDPHSGEIIDEALVLWFPAPHSETGEDVAELQAHGGRAVIAAILDALARVEGLRPAEAGEFTRRGFENGKLDLTAVEGLADLVSAETEGQRRQAFRQMKGLLGGRAETWRQRLIQALALVEARIDFSDEADVPEDLVTPSLTIARELRDEIAAALADGRRGERLREGMVVAIAGPPNAGKSTLLNRIAKREAAIVSPYAGTTRDVIEVHLDLAGLPVTLLDTAGIRDTSDPVEAEGVRRARERAGAADLVLWVVDAADRGAAGSMADLATPGSQAVGAKESGSESAGCARQETQPAAIALPSGPDVPPPSGPDGPRPATLPGLHTVGTEGVGLAPAGTAQQRSQGIGVDSRIPFNAPPPSRLAEPELSMPCAPPPDFVAAGSLASDGPPVWLIRNKMDLIGQGVIRSEQEARFNKPLTNKVNSDLTHNNELKKQTYVPLKNVVNNDALANRNELRPTKNDLEFNVSASSGEGVDALMAQLTRYANASLAGAEPALVTRARHRRALEETVAALERALEPRLAGHEDLVAEELRAAAGALGRLTGRVDVEDVLDVVFRDFCIGK